MQTVDRKSITTNNLLKRIGFLKRRQFQAVNISYPLMTQPLRKAVNMMLKFIYVEKATKFLRNLPLNFDYSTYGQKLGEDFAKFCGLLRIYEL